MLGVFVTLSKPSRGAAFSRHTHVAPTSSTGQPRPADLDLNGEFYIFEYGVEKTDGWHAT
jgi:hypothetical protein